MNLGPRIDLQPKHKKIMTAEDAYILAAKLNNEAKAENDTEWRYEVHSNRDGYYIAVIEVATNKQLGTL